MFVHCVFAGNIYRLELLIHEIRKINFTSVLNAVFFSVTDNIPAFNGLFCLLCDERWR